MLNLDITFVIIALLVWALMLVLDKLYYKPVSRILDQRETKIETETARIETMTTEIEEKTLHIEQTLKSAQKDSSKIKEELIKQGETLRETIVAEARGNSKEMLETRMRKLDEEIAAAEKQLEQEIAVFSGKIKEIFV